MVVFPCSPIYAKQSPMLNINVLLVLVVFVCLVLVVCVRLVLLVVVCVLCVLKCPIPIYF